MEPHHAASIDNLVEALAPDRTIRALILAGSIAHGFARPESDIDVVIVVSAAEYRRRRRDGRMHFLNRDLCTYPGYIDGKYADLPFLRLVARRGSDPARYAFKDCRVLFSRIPDLEGVLAEIACYPVAEKAVRRDRFVAQLLAWRWYYGEATRLDNRYLRMLALQKVVLFACRIVLTENELLYPYQKWLTRVVATAPRQPRRFPASLDELLAEDSVSKVEAMCQDVLDFAEVDRARADAGWPSRFMADTELSWMTHEPAIDDL